MQATMMTARIALAVLVPDGRRERDSRNLVLWNAVVSPNYFARARAKNALSPCLSGISACHKNLNFRTQGAKRNRSRSPCGKRPPRRAAFTSHNWPLWFVVIMREIAEGRRYGARQSTDFSRESDKGHWTLLHLGLDDARSSIVVSEGNEK